MDTNLKQLRVELDTIDEQLVNLLAKRFQVTKKVSIYKRNHKLPPIDIVREEQQFGRINKLAKNAGLDPDFAKQMLRLVIDEVVKNHKQLNQGENNA